MSAGRSLRAPPRLTRIGVRCSYADWCQPCKILTPLLERAVLASKGRVRLVKINVDRERELGAALRVQRYGARACACALALGGVATHAASSHARASIPAVFGVHKGRVVDSFQGALPEADVNKFVEAMSQVGLPRQARRRAARAHRPCACGAGGRRGRAGGGRGR